MQIKFDWFDWLIEKVQDKIHVNYTGNISDTLNRAQSEEHLIFTFLSVHLFKGNILCSNSGCVVFRKPITSLKPSITAAPLFSLCLKHLVLAPHEAQSALNGQLDHSVIGQQLLARGGNVGLRSRSAWLCYCFVVLYYANVGHCDVTWHRAVVKASAGLVTRYFIRSFRLFSGGEELALLQALDFSTLQSFIIWQNIICLLKKNFCWRKEKNHVLKTWPQGR